MGIFICKQNWKASAGNARQEQRTNTLFFVNKDEVPEEGWKDILVAKLCVMLDLGRRKQTEQG
jgi:hypothetical protein